MTMRFHVEMTVNLPPDVNPELTARLKADEKTFSQELHDEGTWRHIWRTAWCHANISIFDVEGPTHLHDLLTRLPLFPYITREVRALCRHASSIRANDR
jgi:muconolactone D-isomerase